MPPRLSLLCVILGKNIQFGIMILLEVQEINLESNMRGSKCDEYCIILKELFRFTKKYLSLRPCSFFFKICLPQLPVMFSTDLN